MSEKEVEGNGSINSPDSNDTAPSSYLAYYPSYDDETDVKGNNPKERFTLKPSPLELKDSILFHPSNLEDDQVSGHLGESISPKFLQARLSSGSLGIRHVKDSDMLLLQDDESEQPKTPHNLESPPASDNGYDNNNNARSQRTITIFGYFTLQRPKISWSRVASWVVRHAPCFWCFGRRLGTSATDRSILLRLNILCAVFAFVQMASALWVAICLFSVDIVNRTSQLDSNEEYAPLSPNLWNINFILMMLGFVSFVLFLTMLFTIPVIREVNLVGSLRYMWTLLWLLPLEFFFVIGLFDYHQVSKVWIKHWWRAPTMAYFRKVFCEDDTYNTKCLVPPGNEVVWCMLNFNATDCAEIRNHAQKNMFTCTSIFYTLNGVWGILLILMLYLTIGVLEGIITKPVVQASREANVPLWLSVPTIGCSTVGILLLYSPTSIIRVASESDSAWIGVVYLVCGVTFFVSALLGWFISSFSILNSRDKKTKIGAVWMFIVLMIGTIIMVGMIFCVSILWSVDLVNYSFSDEQRGDLACSIDSASICTNCDIGSTSSDGRQCPEWSSEDVSKVVRTELKECATLAAIAFLYSIGSLRFGFVLRKHISVYQIDYV